MPPPARPSAVQHLLPARCCTRRVTPATVAARGAQPPRPSPSTRPHLTPASASPPPPRLLRPPKAAAWLPRRAWLRTDTRREPRHGTTTPVPDDPQAFRSKSPFYFEAGYALFAKRPSRPFPPPFLSYPSGSFSDPLSTHHRSRDRRSYVNGEQIRGITNGDDAVLVSDNFIGANDGVGAWAQKDRGHAALWSRLILHFWALEAERDHYGETERSPAESSHPDPVAYLQRAYEQTKLATSKPTEWLGTTTACSALLSYAVNSHPRPVLYVTQLGDSKVLVMRPALWEGEDEDEDGDGTKAVIYETQEQWHWFDCPRQLGTNSPDTPTSNAIMDRIEIEEDDVVLAMSDGVVDNLWNHEIVSVALGSMRRWEKGEGGAGGNGLPGERTYADGMSYVAQEIVKAARKVAEDPFAESPYMEKAVDEGLSIEGGKLDDISVVAAQCKRRKV
ncbi:hypothetical protein BDY21DRAFT_281501 [Lineolata rhizophorae]|uniref:Protein phosphatase n=1 Tax=Lineolata rhizophorae TaxID=578093 RepID=A0A6A6P862_9PEZI|nr:hypothetical protein BDY21DRAFT_281501 [Lineolata rhizophorae]